MRNPDRGAPLRVLHLLGKLDHGGIETWLMHVFRRSDPALVRHEVLLGKAAPGVHDAEALALGVILHRPAGALGHLAYTRRLDRLLAREKFDVVHSHMYLFSGLLLAIARRRGVAQRIAHCHHAAIGQAGGGPGERAKHRFLTALIARFATLKLGISDSAIEEIAGPGWRSHPDNRVLLYGFDFSRYQDAAARAAVLRQQLGIAPGQPVVGHVGRFVAEKNHGLLIDSFAQLKRLRPDCRLVLVGEGPLKAEAQARIAGRGIADSVLFAGLTDDVPAFMAMFDLFALTSTSEGLGIVVLEAQAAGTPAVISSVVPHEVDVVPGLVTRMGLDQPPERWAEAMAASLADPLRERRPRWRELEGSRFGIAKCLARLEAMYRGADAP